MGRAARTHHLVERRKLDSARPSAELPDPRSMSHPDSMSVDDGFTCSANIGWKGHDRPCGEAAVMVTDGAAGLIFMCAAHAVICADQTGASFRRLGPS